MSTAIDPMFYLNLEKEVLLRYYRMWGASEDEVNKIDKEITSVQNKNAFRKLVKEKHSKIQ